MPAGECQRHVYCYRRSFCPSRVQITCQCCGADYFAELLKSARKAHLHAFCKLENGTYQCRIWLSGESKRCSLTLAALPKAEPPCRKSTAEERLAVAALSDFAE
jgi:hypothetical protein